MQTNFIFSIVILILSIALHEASHGYAANRLGDPTARLAGRLTLNPLKHLDLFGSVIIPFLTFITGGFIFGWAKPVPYNPYNLTDQRWGEAKVAFAGPASLQAAPSDTLPELYMEADSDGYLYILPPTWGPNKNGVIGYGRFVK